MGIFNNRHSIYRTPAPQLSRPEPHSAISNRERTARIAGATLLLTAVVTGVSAIGRIAADADQSTITETLDAISRNAGLYGLGGTARLISGITLIAAALLLKRTWIIGKRRAFPSVPSLLVVSGCFTAISGLAAALLSMSAPAASLARSDTDVGQLLETALQARWLTGKIGFTAAGLALIIASRYQWKATGAWRLMAPLSAFLGVAMQFIWIDSATLVHPIIGAGFFLWLLAIGVMLYTGRTKRLFPEMVHPNSY